ncbi:TauD/TfdA dioxygenase family protein [Micromonospora sp. NPDC049900]|uniref:TauD/TfdA dioxygenase family protein n=1 Tax=Micromonospora sp. NPDC049900 TaxID=3364275 RepID=UPI0037BC1DD8
MLMSQQLMSTYRIDGAARRRSRLVTRGRYHSGFLAPRLSTRGERDVHGLGPSASTAFTNRGLRRVVIRTSRSYGTGELMMSKAGVAGLLTLRRTAGHIGAEVDGVDLAGALDEPLVVALRDALLTHKVLFFRDQKLDHAAHVALGERFGTLTVRSRAQSSSVLDLYPQILTISPQIDRELHGVDYEAHYRLRWASGITGWHTDMSHVVNPPAASILRAETVPPFGGDTQWTNLVAAYEGLSAPLRTLCDGLQAEHSFFAGYRMIPSDPIDRRILDMIGADAPVAVHPVVRVHPETGERALFVNPSRTARILGLSPAESRALLDLLFAQVTRPEYTVRFGWAPGSVAFWDNRSTAHLAAPDIDHLDGVERVLHRVTIIGDVPVGPDGFTSRAVSGTPLGADQPVSGESAEARDR